MTKSLSDSVENVRLQATFQYLLSESQAARTVVIGLSALAVAIFGAMIFLFTWSDEFRIIAVIGGLSTLPSVAVFVAWKISSYSNYLNSLKSGLRKFVYGNAEALPGIRDHEGLLLHWIRYVVPNERSFFRGRYPKDLERLRKWAEGRRPLQTKLD